MSFVALVQAGIGSLVQLPIIKELASSSNKKVIEIFRQHFLFSSKDIAEAFQESYGHSMTAIGSGLALEIKRDSSGFVNFFRSAYRELSERFARMGEEKIAREFSNQLKELYLLPYIAGVGISQEEQLQKFCKEGARICNDLSKQSKESLPSGDFPDFEIASLLNSRQSFEISDVLTQRIIQLHPNTDQQVLHFFQYNNLLGNALLYFFKEKLRRNQRVEKTINALRQEGLWADIRDLKGTQLQMKQHLEEKLTEIQAQLAKHTQMMAEYAQKNEFDKVAELASLGKSLQLQQQEQNDILKTLPEKFERAEQTWNEIGGKLDRFETHMGALCDIITDKFSEIQGQLEGFSEDLNEIKKYLRRIERELKRFGEGNLPPGGLNPNEKLKDRYLYDPNHPIGEGAVGRVYKATLHGTGEKRALKVLKSHLSNNEEVVTRFLREATVLYQLKHCENIVRIYKSGGGRDLHFFIEMEFIEGAPLSALTEDWLPFEKVQDIGKQLCHALDACHSIGIIHRDINPNNIMLTHDGTLKLMDFGAAKILGQEGLTQHGNIFGTIHFIAPEQLAGNTARIDRRADIYSIGAVLYLLCTHRPVLLTGQNENIRFYASSVDEWFDRLIMQCLEKDPEKRPADAKELKERLENKGITLAEVTRARNFEQVIKEFLKASHGVFTEAQRTPLLTTGVALGLAKDDAESIIDRLIDESTPPQERYRSWLDERLSEIEELDQESEWDIIVQGVRLRLQRNEIQQILEESLLKKGIQRQKGPETEDPDPRTPRDKTVKQIVWEAVQMLTQKDKEKIFSPREVAAVVLDTYPDFKVNTVNCQIISDCVGHPSRHHYPGGKDRYFRVSRGGYRLFDPQKDPTEEQSSEKSEKKQASHRPNRSFVLRRPLEKYRNGNSLLRQTYQRTVVDPLQLRR